MAGVIGTILITGMVFGSITNAAIDAANVGKNCDNAKKTLKSMQDMRDFYNSMYENIHTDIKQLNKFTQQLKDQYTENKKQVNWYLKNQADIKKRLEIILTLSMCVIYVLFLYKSGIPQYIYNYVSNKFK